MDKNTFISVPTGAGGVLLVIDIKQSYYPTGRFGFLLKSEKS